jgi:hypothetical protein
MTPAQLAAALESAMRAESWMNHVLDTGHMVKDTARGDSMPDFTAETQDGAVYRVLVQLVKDPLHG